MKITTVSLNDKMVAYTDENIFRIEFAHGQKGRYRLQNQIKGDLPRAVMLYNMLNIGMGFRKRLVCRDFNKTVIAKHVSEYEIRRPKFLP